MEKKYCWQCKKVVPFLNKEEYKKIENLYFECMKLAQDNRVRNNAALNDIFTPIREEYEKITGYKNMDHFAILHHSLSFLGPDCPSCGMPLRTPVAKLCPECGWKAEYDEDDWLDGYICEHYVDLMTDLERAGLKALLSEGKATHEEDERDARDYRQRIGLDKPGVSEALKMGYTAFKRRVRKRILLEHSEQVDLNRCPRCDKIPRTPKAKQCPWCYHSWRDEGGSNEKL